MRPRAELGIISAVLFALAMLVVAIAGRHARPTPDDSARSTYLTGPGGTSAFAEAVTRLGVEVERYRRPTATLADSGRRDEVFAVLGPTTPLTAVEVRHLLALSTDLLLAGRSAETAFRCLGYRVSGRPWPNGAVTRALPGVR